MGEPTQTTTTLAPRMRRLGLFADQAMWVGLLGVAIAALPVLTGLAVKVWTGYED